MSFPSSLDAPDTTMQGTSLVTSPDHAANHRTLGSAVISVETKLGIGSGTPKAGYILSGIGNGTSSWGTEWDSGVLGTPSIGTPTITGGTWISGTINNPIIGTPNMNGGTASLLDLEQAKLSLPLSTGTTAITFQNAITVSPFALTDVPGGTVAISNSGTSNTLTLVLGTTAGNRTFGTPLAPSDGQILTFRIKQNTNNTGTILFVSAYRFFPSGTPTLGTQLTWNYLGFRYNQADTKFDYQGNSLGLI